MHKTTNPYVSVITCTLNSELYLEQTMSSVLAQDYENIEFIIVDGCSRDSTMKIIEDYAHKDKRINCVSEPDKGLSDAMNKGISRARGDIITHLHSDDYYCHKGVIKMVVNEFAKTPDARWLFGNMNIVDETNKVLCTTQILPFEYRRLKKSNQISHPGVFLKSDIFSEYGGFDTSLRFAMDYDLWLRIGKDNIPLQMEECLVNFRFHPGCYSFMHPREAIQEEYSIRRKYFGNSIMWRIVNYVMFQKKRYDNWLFYKQLTKARALGQRIHS